MKRFIVISVSAILFGMAASAQDYSLGFGLRSGLPTGLDVKYFTDSKTAVEGILGLWEYNSGFSVTGLYEIHKSLNPKNLKFYYGGGARMGVLNGHVYNYLNNSYGGPFFGVAGALGLEYAVREIPLSVSIDWNPGIALFVEDGIVPLFEFLGLTARYTMK